MNHLENLEAQYENEIAESISYLNSKEAEARLDADAYWPKWHSPWWHMLLLHEMSLTQKIPESTIHRYIQSLNRIQLKIFPIHPEDAPADIDPYRGTSCHCQLGNVYQVLSKWGVDVDAELPWIRPWLLRYQMADGGMNCDNEAYLVKDETPSSMVGSIAAFESVLYYPAAKWTSEEKKFLERGAQFLIGRQLILGSSTTYNSSERESAKEWAQLCFPRFYLYDTLRGLHALLAWSEKTQTKISPEAIELAVKILEQKSQHGILRNERLSFGEVTTIAQNSEKEWLRRQPATTFSLLTKVSEVGAESVFLERQWQNCQLKLRSLTNASPH